VERLTVSPVAGRDYPRSYAELRAWLTRTRSAWPYLDWLRWPDEFVCPGCGSLAGWRLSDTRWLCGLCKRKGSATAGTIFDKTLPARLTREWTRGIVNSRRSTNTPGLAQHGRATW